MSITDSASVTRRSEGAPTPSPPMGALAQLSFKRRAAVAAALGPRQHPPYVDAVAFVRRHREVTTTMLREHFGWPINIVNNALYRARMHGLIVRTRRSSRLMPAIYRPVVVPGWPE